MEFDQKHLLNQEDYLAKEKIKILNLNLLISLLSLIFMLASAISSFLLDSIYSSSIPLLLGLLSLYGIFNAIFSFIWSIWQRRVLLRSQEKWGESTDSLFSRLLFISSTLLFFTLLVLIIALYLWTARGLALFLASNSPGTEKDFISQWETLRGIITSCGIINLLIFFYQIYAAFVCCGAPNTVRVLLYLSGLLQVVFGFFVLNYVKMVFQYGEETQVAKFLDLSLYGVMGGLIIVLIITVIMVYIVNYKRWRGEYLMCGALMMILAVILIGLGGSVYREGLLIQASFNDNCKVYLSALSSDDVETYGCSRKYWEYGNNYLNCTDSEQVLVWEDEIDGELNRYKNSIGCLNTQCCSIIGDVYDLNLLKLESFNIALIAMTFISISACFFLTNKYSGDRSLKRILEYLYIIAIFLLLIAGLVSLFLFEAQLPEERILMSVTSDSFKTSTNVNYSMNTQFLPSSSCELINEKNPSYNLSQIFPNSSLSTLGVRTIVLVANADLYYDNSQSFADIQLFDKELGSLLFPGLSLIKKDFLIFQGNATNIQNFVSESLYLCPYNMITPIYMEYFTVQINITTNIADNSTLTWLYGTSQYLQTAESHLQTTKSHLTQSHLQTTQNHLQTTKSHREAQNLVNKTEYLNNVSNITELQTKLNSLKYGDLNLTVYSVSSGTLQSNISIYIYSGSQTVCSNNPETPILSLYTDENGESKVYNLPYGEYTIIGSSKDFQPNCLLVKISKRSLNKALFLVETLEEKQLAVLLEWNTAIDLNIFGAFALSSEVSCIVGYFNEECTGVSYKKGLSLETGSAQLIEITTLGQYEYLFFLKRELSWSEYNGRIVNQTELNTDFLSSTFTLKAYSNEIKYPVAEISYSGSGSWNASMVNATDLSYLGFCVNGSKSDLFVEKEVFWVGNGTFPVASTVC